MTAVITQPHKPARSAEELVKRGKYKMGGRGGKWISLKFAAAWWSAVCAVNLPLVYFSDNRAPQNLGKADSR